MISHANWNALSSRMLAQQYRIANIDSLYKCCICIIFSLIVSLVANSAQADAARPAADKVKRLDLAYRSETNKPLNDHAVDSLIFNRLAVRNKQPTSFNPKDTRLEHQAAAKILSILLTHFIPGNNDPTSIKFDLEAMSSYYSHYPRVVELFNALANAPWKLQFSRNRFYTKVKGTALTVTSAKIHFDPRSGAKLKFNTACGYKIPFCVASPADALLHELLHTRMILLQTEDFIASGAMSSLMYPFEHERKTIEEENRLYKSMTKLDHKPRPIRNEHAGRHVLVGCATCVE